MQIVYKKIL